MRVEITGFSRTLLNNYNSLMYNEIHTLEKEIYT